MSEGRNAFHSYRSVYYPPACTHILGQEVHQLFECYNYIGPIARDVQVLSIPYLGTHPGITNSYLVLTVSEVH